MINASTTPLLRFLVFFAAIICLVASPAFELKAQSYSSNDDTARYYQGYNRDILSSNSLGIEQGRFIYTNFMVFVNSLSYGITDNISVSAGFYPGFLINIETPVYIKPEITLPIQSDWLNVSGGFYLFSTIERGTNTLGGIAFTKATLGNQRYNASLSAGFLFSDDSRINSELRNEPIISINAHLRYTTRFAFITENYFVPSDAESSILSIGQRFYPGRAAVDFILFIFPGSLSYRDSILMMPALGVTIPF